MDMFQKSIAYEVSELLCWGRLRQLVGRATSVCGSVYLTFIAQGALAQQAPVKVPKADQAIKVVTGAAGRLLGVKGPLKLLFGLAVVLVIALGVFLWKRRKRVAASAVAADNAAQLASPPTSVQLAPSALAAAFKRFLKQLPRSYRRSIENFQSFVVLGPATSGKTGVISRYTDWQRQAQQAIQSYTSDANLKVYLGSRSLVFELGPGLLWDTSVGARKACMKLFARFGSRWPAVAVVVLDLPALSGMSPDSVRALADGIRAKVNLLSTHRPRWKDQPPLEVRVVLTHLDTLPGYRAFAKFAQDKHHNIALRFSIDPDGTDLGTVNEQVLAGFAGFGRFLSLALTRLPAEQFREIVAFLHAAPAYCDNLGLFVDAFYAKDSLSQRPVAGGFYLAADGLSSAGSDPFHVAKSAEDQRRGSVRARHLWKAYGGAAALCVWMIAGFAVSRSGWENVTSYMEALELLFDNYEMERLPPDEVKGRSEVRAQLFSEIAGWEVADIRSYLQDIRAYRKRQSWAALLTADFYGVGDKVLDSRLSLNLRERFLCPALQVSLESSLWPYQESLYQLAVIHGSRGSRLGAIALELTDTLIDSELGRQFGVEMGREVIEGYLEASARPYPGRVGLHKLQERHVEQGSFDMAGWRSFVKQISSDIAVGEISVSSLAKRHSEATVLVHAVDAVRRFSETHAILRSLSQYRNHYQGGVPPQPVEGLESNLLGPMGDVLNMVLETPALAQQAPVRLKSLASKLTAIAQQPQNKGAIKICLPAAGGRGPCEKSGEVIELGRQGWQRLIRSSQVRQLIGDYIRQNVEPLAAFFSEDYAPLSGARDGKGRAGAIDSRYTSLAVASQVRPSLEAFVHAIRELEAQGLVSEAQRIAVRSAVSLKVVAYAAEYRRHVDAFYREFEPTSASGDALAVLFSDLAQPTSALTSFLTTVQKETALEIASDDAQLQSLLQPLAQVAAAYGSIQRIMGESAGEPRALDTYLGYVERVRGRVAEPTLVGPPGDQAVATLHDRLAGPGQIALEYYTNVEDNLRHLVALWVRELELNPRLARPFVQPFEALMEVGGREINQELSAIWNFEVKKALSPLLRKFPFTRDAVEEVTSVELYDAFHPQEGLVVDHFERFFEPVLRVQHGVYRPLPHVGELPKGMTSLLGHARRLSKALWDAEGNPQTLPLRVRAIPFGATADKRSVLTLAYVRFGDESYFNFNQKPVTKVLQIPWDRPHMSQVGVQLTDARNGSQRYPRSKVTAASFFSELRLLGMAVEPLSAPRFRTPGGRVLTERRWAIPFSNSGTGLQATIDCRSKQADCVEVRFFADHGIESLFEFVDELADSATALANVHQEPQ